uniref:AlNc14C246G9548 protein n=1 Tax=Albugo laibachii Nc14 TaxID=890382 RepID=F0WT63_9STRA|nr:AlNc14C246G9548 [Albugo laibachii Nc14]|eukprot:CCA24551.1 AlNc14C246G9548 [Albugo laibachii Nc14]
MKVVDSEEDDLTRVEDGYVQEVQLFEENESVLASFMMPSASERRNLADIIMEKIQQKEAGEGEMSSTRSNNNLIQKSLKCTRAWGRYYIDTHRENCRKRSRSFRV